MERIKPRTKRKAPEESEREVVKKTRPATTDGRGTCVPKEAVSREGSRDSPSEVKSASPSNSKGSTPSTADGPKASSSGSARATSSRTRSRDANSDSSKDRSESVTRPDRNRSHSSSRMPTSRLEKLDVTKLDSRILELVENDNSKLFRLVYNVSIGYFDPVKCVDVIRFYLYSNADSGATEEPKSGDSDHSDADSSDKPPEAGYFGAVGPNGFLIYKLLDLVSFFLDVSKKKSNLLYFLQTLEALGVNREIISVVDANKLDSCNYSEGLVKILVRERTRNNYVLKVFNLYRECPKGFMVLTNYLSGLDAASAHTEGVAYTVKNITGQYKLCPLRVLYELLNWLVLNYFSDEFVLGLLSMFRFKQIWFCVLFYLQTNALAQPSPTGKPDAAECSSNASCSMSVDTASGGCSGIYGLLSLLISNSWLNLEDLYCYLAPPDSSIAQLCSHFISTVKSSSAGTNLASGSHAASSAGSADSKFADNPVVAELTKAVSFYTVSNEYLHCYVAPGDKYARRVEYLVTLFSGLSSTVVSTPNAASAKQEPSPAGAGNTCTTLLGISNYQLLKNCVYAFNFPKAALLSELLSRCDDFCGVGWDGCYSLIVHLFGQRYYVFFNTSLVHRFHCIIERVLSGSYFYNLGLCSHTNASASADNGMDCDAGGSVDWASERVLLNKLEYYFMFVGFRASEHIVLFNRLLNYLYQLLVHLNSTQSGDSAQSKDGATHASMKRKLTKLIYKYVLFNIMNCCEGNFQVSDKMWSILKLFTTLERYKIYSKSYELLTGHDKADLPSHSEESEAAQLKASYYATQLHFVRRTHRIYNHKLKNIFKKITCELLKSVKSPTIRSIVSIITAISATNPFSVVSLIIKQSEMFNNLLLPLCELTKYFQAYTIDIFIYQLTVNLLALLRSNAALSPSNRGSSPHPTGDHQLSLSACRLDCANLIKEDDSNKISVNSVILCKIFKRHNDCDIAPLLSVLVLLLNYALSSQLVLRHPHADLLKRVPILLDSGNYYEVVLAVFKVLDYLVNLFELINGITIVDMNKMTNDQLLSQCGSFALKTESLLMNLDDDVNLGNKKLFKMVSRPFFLHSLLLILGRLLNELVYDSYFNNYKLLVQLVSKFHSVVMLLVEFLATSAADSHARVSGIGLISGNGLNSKLSGAEPAVSGADTAAADAQVTAQFLDRLAKYYNSNYMHFFRQYLFNGFSAPSPDKQPASAKSSPRKRLFRAAAKQQEEEVLDEKFVQFINALNIYDIFVPVEQYNHYINKLVNHYNQLCPASGGAEPKSSAELGASGPNSVASTSLHSSTSPPNPALRALNTLGGRTPNGTLGRRLKRIKNRISALTSDRQLHVAHNAGVLERLRQVSQSFVKNEQKVGPHVTIAFISKIIYPRVFISELNSMFCCKLVDLMMLYRVNYFNYFDFVNCYCKLLVPLINYSTESEVINFSLFFNYSFSLIKTWIHSKQSFEKLVVDNPCFCLTFRFNPEKQFKYQQLLQVLKKWEYLILVSLFSCATPTPSAAVTGASASSTTPPNTTTATNTDQENTDTTANEPTNANETDNPANNVNETATDSPATANENANSDELHYSNHPSASPKQSPNDNAHADAAAGDGASETLPSAASRSVDGLGASEPVGKLNSWIEIKNVVIFLNKVSANFPVSHNSSVKVVNFLKNILKVSKRENWQDVTVCANTLIKTMQMHQNQGKYITLS